MDDDLRRAILRAYEDTSRSREATAAALEGAAAHCAALAHGLRFSLTGSADSPQARDDASDPS